MRSYARIWGRISLRMSWGTQHTVCFFHDGSGEIHEYIDCFLFILKVYIVIEFDPAHIDFICKERTGVQDMIRVFWKVQVAEVAVFVQDEFSYTCWVPGIEAEFEVGTGLLLAERFISGELVVEDSNRGILGRSWIDGEDILARNPEGRSCWW